VTTKNDDIYGVCEVCGLTTIYSEKLGKFCPHCFLANLKKAKREMKKDAD